MAICGNGAAIGMLLTRHRQSKVNLVALMAVPIAFFAAVASLVPRFHPVLFSPKYCLKQIPIYFVNQNVYLSREICVNCEIGEYHV